MMLEANIVALQCLLFLCTGGKLFSPSNSLGFNAMFAGSIGSYKLLPCTTSLFGRELDLIVYIQQH